MPATDKRHKRRCVDRLRIHRSRHPAPGSTKVGPATVVSYRKTPRRVIDPSPTPWCDPRPMPVMVRRPARRNARCPDVAVLGVGAPSTEIVQVLVPDEIRWNIAGRDGAFPAAVSLMRPRVKVV